MKVRGRDGGQDAPENLVSSLLKVFVERVFCYWSSRFPEFLHPALALEFLTSIS